MSGFRLYPRKLSEKIMTKHFGQSILNDPTLIDAPRKRRMLNKLPVPPPPPPKKVADEVKTYI